jgi:hypothetical protein
MQAVALVTSDEFLVQYNLTIDTDDVIDYIRILSIDWTKTTMTSYFDDLYGIDFAAIISPFGFCYNFNLVEAHRVFELSHLPSSFNYSKKYLDRNQVFKYRIRAEKSRKPYPLSIVDYRAGLFSSISQTGSTRPYDLCESSEDDHR